MFAPRLTLARLPDVVCFADQVPGSAVVVIAWTIFANGANEVCSIWQVSRLAIATSEGAFFQLLD